MQTNDDDMMTLSAVAAMAGSSPATIKDRSRRGDLPAPIRIGSHYMYRRSEVVQAFSKVEGDDEWMSSAAAAALLGWSYDKLLRRAARGTGPIMHPRGPWSRRFLRSEVLAYLERQGQPSDTANTD